MTKLFETFFLEGSLPEGWLEPFQSAYFDGECLRSETGAVLNIPLPKGYEKTLIEVEVEPVAGAKLTCSDGASTFVMDLIRGEHLINHSGPALLAQTQMEVSPAAKTFTLSFLFGQGLLQASVGGVVLVQATDPNSFLPSQMFEFGFWDDCRIHRIACFGEGEIIAEQRAVVQSAPLELEVTVDFVDDLLYAPWTLGMFDELFAKLKSWGVARCHWIYYGSRAEGWWDGAAMDASRNAAETMDNVGEIFPAAVQAAHRHGIQIVGLIKPFDMGIPQHQEANQVKLPKALPRIGGEIGWIARFPVEHRELVMARKPKCFGEARQKRFTRIDLVKNDATEAGFSVADVRLFTSDDNLTYRPYDGTCVREEVIEDYPVWEHTSSGGRPTDSWQRVRVMRFTELDIRTKFLAVEINSGNGTFTNTLVNLLHVFGEDGEERTWTYGLDARSGGHELTDNVSAAASDPDFRKYGVSFDYWPATPSGIFPGFDPISTSFTLDRGAGFIAIAFGKDEGTLAALSPSFPEVRNWWLSWVKACLDAGADGIELRERNHHSHLAWGEFGFEAPVRERFLAQYGVDLWETDDFDKGAWAQLRGEDYTQFYREAREMTKSYGKPMGVHISLTNNPGPEGRSAMNIHWDWKQWLDETLADSITLKDILPGSRMAREVMALAEERNIQVIYSHYANNLWQHPGGEEVCRSVIKLVRESGGAGYQFYECAAVIQGNSKGELVVTQPSMTALLQEEFAERF